MKRVAVLLPLPFDRAFCYLVPDDIEIELGCYVVVPFGARTCVGIVWSLDNYENIPEEKCKFIIEVVNLPPINAQLLAFLQWASLYNLIPVGLLFKMALGGSLTVKSLKFIDSLPKDNPCTNDKKASFVLNVDQNSAVEKIINYLSQNITILLDGETGSGKTEVYCKVIDYLLTKFTNAQILIILPEITLTSQLMQRVKKYFADYQISEWHSNLTPKNRRNNWTAIAKGESSITIGARSALFLPYKNLKLIIVDEEHDSSLKQEQGTLYNARDLAVVLAKKLKILILLCSATPSLESIYNVSKKNYVHVRLKKRFGSAQLPDISIVDMRKSSLINKWLSSDLYNQIITTLNKNQQVMLFLNRRGFSQVVLCKACGYKISCPRCTINLVEHKIKHIMLCHHCNYQIKIPLDCPQCSEKESLISCGTGIERVSQQLSNLLPQAKIVTISSDFSDKIINSTIQEIIDGTVNIIIGTQLIAKGHNFPNLTLVAVLDADSGFNGCDLRATEKNYQVLHQVAGRAGRFSEKGMVILQSYNPEHPTIQALQNYDRDSFYTLELQSRLAAKMPPYFRLIAIIVTGPKIDEITEISRIITVLLNDAGLMVLGPVAAPIGKINQKYRYRILIKITNKVPLLRQVLKNQVLTYNTNRLKITIDIDPLNFM